MTRLNHEILIDAPADAVWAVLADLPAVAQYNDGVTSAAWKSELREGVGAARVCHLTPTGEVTEEVTSWEPRQALGLRVASSPWPPITTIGWVTRLEPISPRQTRVTQALDYTVGLGPVGAAFNRLVIRRKLESSIDKIFTNLKAHVEQRDRSQPGA